MPSFSSGQSRATCSRRVSGCLTAVTQQIHSLRASGVMSSHAASAALSAARAFRISSGRTCTTPPEIALVTMCLSYQELRNFPDYRAKIWYNFFSVLSHHGDERYRQRDSWCVFASIRDGNGSRYPLVAKLSATADKLATYKNAFANFKLPSFEPAFALAA